MKKRVKKTLCWLSLTAVFTSALAVSAVAEETIKVLLNGTELTFDVPPQMVDDRTMVPMRKIFEALGAEVSWNNDTRTVTAVKEDTTITMQVDNAVMAVNEKEIMLDVPPQLIDDRTLVPVRAVAEGLDAEVNWDGSMQTVTITKKDLSSVPSNPDKPARYPQDGLLYGYGNDGVAELQYNARYLFEQKTFPNIVFENKQKTIAYITAGNADKMKENILGMWEVAAANVILNDAELSGEKLDTQSEDELWALVDERRPLYGLDDRHIKSVTLETIDTDTTAVIAELEDTGWSMLSTYIGIAYHKTKGLSCFTLEKSIDLTGKGDIPYMFCHVEGDSRGSYFAINNDRQSFVNAIKTVMSTSSVPNTEKNKADGTAVIDGVSCTLKATITVMDFGNGNTSSLDDGILTSAGISVYNDQEENITSSLQIEKMQITKGAQTFSQNIQNKKDAQDYAYQFVSDWKAGDHADVTVQVKDTKGNIIELNAKNVTVWNMEQSLQNMLGPDVKVKIS